MAAPEAHKPVSGLKRKRPSLCTLDKQVFEKYPDMEVNERGLSEGQIALEYDESKTPDKDLLFALCSNWTPDTSSESIIAFRRDYITNVLDLPSCFCGHVPIKKLVVKKTSVNVGKYFYTCPFARRCGFFRYENADDQEKNDIQNKLKRAKFTKSELRTADKYGWIGTKRWDNKLLAIQKKVDKCNITSQEFNKAREYGLF